MEKNCITKLVLFASGVLLCGSTLANAEKKVQDLTKICKSCHTINSGESEFEGPQLGGFSDSYIAEQLNNFREGLRGEGDPAAIMMASAAKYLSDDDISVLSDWASSLDSKEILNFDESASEKGAQLYKDQCKGCHSSFIGKMVTKSPSLDFLDVGYIERQLKAIASENRKFGEPNKHKTKMKTVTKNLSKDELEQILRYMGKK